MQSQELGIYISSKNVVVTCFLWIIAVLENQLFWTVLPLNYVLLIVIVQRVADVSGLPQGWVIVKKRFGSLDKFLHRFTDLPPIWVFLLKHGVPLWICVSQLSQVGPGFFFFS